MVKAASKKSYLDVSYNEKKLPRTQYPKQLAGYLRNKFLPQQLTMLDVGCGRGEFLEAFSSLGLQVEGVDISPSVKNIEGFKGHQCDFENEKLPYKNDTFECIFSKSVVEHLHYPERLIDECFRVLKPGGRAIFMCPSWVHTHWGPFYIDHTHVTPFTLPSLTQLLELSGFKILNGEHFIQLPIIWRMPFLQVFCELLALLPLPYAPLYKRKLPGVLNKWVRFSKEKMLLVVGEKI
jgi:SAM-dependent methyltransferase